MTIEQSASLAKVHLQDMLAGLAERHPVGTTIDARINSRQKEPSRARVVGHSIEISVDGTPLPMLIISANTKTPAARQATVQRTVRLADITVPF